jgi:hypothetical protein
VDGRQRKPLSRPTGQPSRLLELAGAGEVQRRAAAKFSGNNDETLNSFDAKQWNATVQQLDKVLTDWEKAVEAADEKKLETWASTIAHIGTHNAYHVGQIIYVRKLQGSWDPGKGVK